MSALKPPPDADQAARELADALEARGVDTAVGGALALAQWGVIRGTFRPDSGTWGILRSILTSSGLRDLERRAPSPAGMEET